MTKLKNDKIRRIQDNENKLDKINVIIQSLNNNIDDFENIINDYVALNNYYGSKEWFNDKSLYEKGKINKVKAGVLSEDAVWNLDESMHDLINQMEEIVHLFKEKEGQK